MDRNKTIELLKQALSEVPRLRTLDHHNRDFTPWLNKVCDILEVAFSKNSTEYARFSKAVTTWWGRSDTEKQEAYNSYLNNYETALKSIIDKYEIIGIEEKPATVAEPTKDTTESPVNLFDKMQFHPRVIESSRELFKDGHYRDAIYRAFVEVNNSVKGKTNSRQLDGRKLMSTVFSLDNPIIKLNSLKTQSDKDEQEGFMFLFMGAMEGIRNPKAHENIIQKNPYRTLEYLGLASLLTKISEEGKLVETESKEQNT